MRVAFWTAMGITTLVMIAGGVAKLTGHPVAHGVFADLGTPGWLVYAVGVC